VQNGQTLRHPKCMGAAPTKGGVVEGAHPLLGVSLTLTLNPKKGTKESLAQTRATAFS